MGMYPDSSDQISNLPLSIAEMNMAKNQQIQNNIIPGVKKSNDDKVAERNVLEKNYYQVSPQPLQDAPQSKLCDDIKLSKPSERSVPRQQSLQKEFEGHTRNQQPFISEAPWYEMYPMF